MEKIAEKRRLKINTIHDHLVEIALYDRQFNIDPFVPKNIQRVIERVVENNPSFKLSTIKEQVGEDVSYFQIRLVLCKQKTKE